MINASEIKFLIIATEFNEYETLDSIFKKQPF